MIEMLTITKGMAKLDRLENAAIELLGLDGFWLQQDGTYEAPLHLIVDFSAETPARSASERFAEARRFMISNDAANVRWEIVSGSSEE